MKRLLSVLTPLFFMAALHAQSNSPQAKTESHTQTDGNGNVIRHDTSWSYTWSSDSGMPFDSSFTLRFGDNNFSFGFGTSPLGNTAPDMNQFFSAPFGGFDFGNMQQLMEQQQKQMEELMKHFGMDQLYTPQISPDQAQPATPPADGQNKRKVKSKGATTTL